MSLVVHIPFYNPNPKKKEGFKNLTREEYLIENINNIKSLNIKKDIFIHTHNDFIDHLSNEVNIVKHNLCKEDLDKGYLTWLTRPVMEKQKNNYEFFMYLEHDIKFTNKNLDYWKKYNNILKDSKFNLGFLIYEKNQNDQKNYSIHVQKKFFKYLLYKNNKFFVNHYEPYCCMWIYDSENFRKFIKTKWWNFNWKGKNYLAHHGVTEMSAFGWHHKIMDRFDATILPEVSGVLDEGCFIEHITNNYFNKFSDKEKFNNFEIRGVCKVDINNIIEDKKFQKKYKKKFFLYDIILKILWQFRFLKKIKRFLNK